MSKRDGRLYVTDGSERRADVARAHGRMAGRIDLLLVVLSDQGFEVPEATERILYRAGQRQLQTWGRRAARMTRALAGGSLTEVFLAGELPSGPADRPSRLRFERSKWRGYPSDSIDREYERGRVEGKAAMLLVVLRARFGPVPPTVRHVVRTCTDSFLLHMWTRHALWRPVYAEVFGWDVLSDGGAGLQAV